MTDKNMLVLQICTDTLSLEHGLSSETSVWSSDAGNKAISIKNEGEEIHIKEEVEPTAISCSSIKKEREVSPKAFHRYPRLRSVIMPFVCLLFHFEG